ncbi:MAG: MarR family winged helix-turn-helix transcriptional regulator [Deltaproteobacteria bacterium]|nr:MarR family winged helix-turn-helix transcriptional regulator [Deltaproteobacteria bacterium]
MDSSAPKAKKQAVKSVKAPPKSAVKSGAKQTEDFEGAEPALELLAEEGLQMLMARAGRAIAEKVESAVVAHGESLILFRPLAIVVRFGAKSQQDIARLTAQHPAGVSRIVEDLEKRGLIRRERAAHDRRTVLVEPTLKGRRLFAKVNPSVLAALESAIGGLNEQQRAHLLEALEIVVRTNGT